jgi:hypothetical protein
MTDDSCRLNFAAADDCSWLNHAVAINCFWLDPDDAVVYNVFVD